MAEWCSTCDAQVWFHVERDEWVHLESGKAYATGERYNKTPENRKGQYRAAGMHHAYPERGRKLARRIEQRYRIRA